MEKRSSKRKVSGLDVMLISRSLNYKGRIKNFAEDGICISIDTEQNLWQLLEGMLFDVKINVPSGAEIDLLCKVTRTHRQKAGESGNIVGMKIIN